MKLFGTTKIQGSMTVAGTLVLAIVTVVLSAVIVVVTLVK